MNFDFDHDGLPVVPLKTRTSTAPVPRGMVGRNAGRALHCCVDLGAVDFDDAGALKPKPLMITRVELALGPLEGDSEVIPAPEA